MRRIAVLLLTLVATLIAVTPDAVAKGDAAATLDGPGLEEPIEFNTRSSNRIASFSGLYNNGGTGREADPNSRTLGPRYLLTLAFSGTDLEIKQHVYPYAPSGSWIFTPKQDLSGYEIGPLWIQSPDSFFDRLVRNGLPVTSPMPLINQPANAPTITGTTPNYSLPSIALAVTALIAGCALVSRRLRGTVAQK